MFMNEYEIDDAYARYHDHPILGPATITLCALRDATNACSDGWAYWPKPSRAARKLQELIHGPNPQCYYDDERPCRMHGGAVHVPTAATLAQCLDMSRDAAMRPRVPARTGCSDV